MNALLTIDRIDGILRAALWKDGDLRDLLCAKIDSPDLTGAIVAGRVARLMPSAKAAWIEGGIEGKIYVENVEGLKSGDEVILRVKKTARQGKAHAGALLSADEAKLFDPKETGLLFRPSLFERVMALCGNEPIGAIVVADKEDHAACAAHLKAKHPQKSGVLKPHGKSPIPAEIDDLWEELREPRVDLKGGGSLVIESTEALVAIDVNAGEAANPLAVNLIAAGEIARQIRLRNLSGIIVVDALKMRARPDQSKLLNALKRATAGDPAGVNVFGMTKLGLVEMTRQNVGSSLNDLRV
jgi:Ribonuclease G/E